MEYPRFVVCLRDDERFDFAFCNSKNKRALVEFEIDCIIINEKNELYGGGEVDTDELCEEDRKHVGEQARSISSAYEVDHTPVFAVSKRVVHFICLEAGDCA
jgi:hypothetical protein